MILRAWVTVGRLHFDSASQYGGCVWGNKVVPVGTYMNKSSFLFACVTGSVVEPVLFSVGCGGDFQGGGEEFTYARAFQYYDPFLRTR